MRVLLIDDSRAYHEEFAQLLADCKMHVRSLDFASNAVEGARLVACDLHDIYFIDYRLPGESGLALIKAARLAGVVKAFVVLTGDEDPQIDFAAEEVGASDYLQKGEFSPQLLGRAIRYARRNAAALIMAKEAESRFIVADRAMQSGILERSASEAANLVSTTSLQGALMSSQAETLVGHADLLASKAVNDELGKMVEERTASLMRAVEHRRSAEEALRQGEKLRMIGELTGSIAHDFNNFLQVIFSGVALLRPPGLTHERRTNLLDSIDYAAKSTTALTKGLLAFSRKQVLQPQAFDMNARLANMCDLLRPMLGSSIRLEANFAPGLWPVLADPTQLEVAILNLAVNARDAMLPEGGVLTFRTSNTTLPATLDREAGDFVCLTVKDSGCGMPPTVRARVFEPFFTTKETGQGTGLGLAQVYGFAKQSGGDVAIESTSDKGTVICFHLPRANAAVLVDATLLQKNAGGDNPFIRAAARTILIVDDNIDVGNFTASIIEAQGYNIMRATNSADALAMLDAGETIDAVLSDVVMPGAMNGAQLARVLRLRYPQVAVVLATGYSQLLLDQNGADAAEVLSKPYRLDELTAALHRAFAMRVTPGYPDASVGRRCGHEAGARC